MASTPFGGGYGRPMPSGAAFKRFPRGRPVLRRQPPTLTEIGKECIDSLAWRVASVLTYISLLLEFYLTWCNSLAYWLFLDVLRVNELFDAGARQESRAARAYRQANARQANALGASERAWWNTSKGSAIVVYGAGSQILPQSLAISLASCRRSTPHTPSGSPTRSRSPQQSFSDEIPLGAPRIPFQTTLDSIGVGPLLRFLQSALSRDLSPQSMPHPASRAPFTVIMLIPDPEDLGPVVRGWASRKAELERPRVSPATSPRYAYGDYHANPLDSPELRPSRPPSPKYGMGTSTASSSVYGGEGSTRSRRRTLSWSPSAGLVGFRDLWKGLRVGEQIERSDFGAVIPVVCDLSTREGLEEASTTVMSYCNSHDLLFRGLVTVSSAASPNTASDAAPSKDRFFASTAADDSSASIAELVTTMLPLLQRDRGRLISVTLPTEVPPYPAKIIKSLEDDVFLARVHLYGRYEKSSLSDSITSAYDKTRVFSLTANIKAFLALNSSLWQNFLGPPLLEEQFTIPDDTPRSVHGLLLHAVRSGLSRTHPRSLYCIGIGPRIQGLVESLPIVARIRRLLASCLD